MEIKRINTYNDPHFSQNVLNQYGCFLFVDEARKHGVYTPKDMSLISHSEYEQKWNRFCDEIFAEATEN